MRFDPIDYLQWAKAHHQHPSALDLASSGMASRALEELELTPDDLQLTAPNFQGFGALKDAIAAHHGVDADQVLIAAGSSMANFLAVLSEISPGDPVLVESPCYEPLRRLPTLFGCQVAPVERSPETGWTLDVTALAEAIDRHSARLVILSNPHNPSGVFLDTSAMESLYAVCAARSCTLLVDEVYAEFHPHDAAALAPLTAENLVRTSSLTKVLGFGPLRIGWALASPERTARMYALNDYASVVHGAINERLGVAVWRQHASFVEKARRRAGFNLPVLRRFLETRTEFDWVDPGYGILAFPQLQGHADTGPFTETLLGEEDVVVVPGAYFDRPGHIRIGIGGPPDLVRDGLRRLGRALDAWNDREL